MSRIGKQPVVLPAGVKAQVADGKVRVEGPKGKLELTFHRNMKVQLDDKTKAIQVNRPDDERLNRALHGLTRSLIANMVEGVTKGFRKSLEIQGVGYRAAKAGEKLNLSLGYSHPIVFEAPTGISFTVEGTTKIHVDGIDKQRVGQTAAEIRGLREPEPYKGKGIRYDGEVVRKKLGKAGKAAKK